MSAQGSPYDPLIDQAAQEYGIDPQIFRAQLNQESRLDPTRVNPKSGAAGIAQFMPATAQEYGIDPMNPEQAIPAAAHYMRRLLNSSNGDYPTALASYNWGPGNVQRHGLANAPPETVDYVRRILGGDTGAAPSANDNGPEVLGTLGPPPGQEPEVLGTLGQAPTAKGQGQEPEVLGTLAPAPAPASTTQDFAALANYSGATELGGPNVGATMGATVQPDVLGTLEAPATPPQPTAPTPPQQPFSLADLSGASELGGPNYGATVGTTTPNDIASSAQQGFIDAFNEGVRTGQGQAFADQPPGTAPPPQRSFAGDIAYSLAHSSPTIAGAMAGGAAGAAIPIGGETGLTEVAGAGLGAGAVSFAQALAPAYREARAQGMSHDDAVNYAWKQAGVEGAANVVAAPLMKFAPFKSVVGKILFNTFVTQPAVGAGARTASAVAADRPLPTPREYARGYAQDVVSGAAIAGVHAAYSGVKGAFRTPQDALDHYFEQRRRGTDYRPGPERPGDLNSSSTAAPQTDQGFTVDDRGYVVSDKGGPIKFTDTNNATAHGQVGRWIVGTGQTKSKTGQLFEPAVHPSGDGMSVRLRTPAGQEVPQQQPQPEPTPQPAQPAPAPAEAPAPQGEAVVTPPPVPEGPTPGAVEPAPPSPKAPEPLQPAPPVTGVAPDTGRGGAVVEPPPAGGAVRQPEPVGFVGPAPPVGDVSGPATPPLTPTAKAEGGPGTSVVLKTQDGSLSVPTNYEVVDLSQLKPATGALQPRDRGGRAASDQQIAANAARLDPNQLMAGPTADYGAPVVTPDGTILAGNGRVASIARAAELHPEVYQRYVDQLKAAGHDVTGMKTPVLVRRTGALSPEEQVTFARDSNVSRAMAMSPVEQAKSDASQLSDEMVARYVPGNQQFVRDWVGSLPPSEHARILDAEGRLSKEGERRLQGALLHKAYGSDDLTTRALEDPSDDTKGITNSLADAAPQWAALRGKVAAGDLPKEFDITPQLTRAIDMVRQQRERGLTPADMVEQRDAFTGELDPVTEELYRSFYNPQMTRLASRTKLTGILKDYIDGANDFTPGKDLLGQEATPNPAQLLKDARVGEQPLLSQAEETPVDTTKAARPQDQVTLDNRNAQLDKLNKRATELQNELASATGIQKTAATAELAERQKQIDRLTETRDSLLPRRPAKKPVDTSAPRPTGAAPTFQDYQFEKGTPFEREAFIKAGLDPNIAVNLPIKEQVEILRNQVEQTFEYKAVKIDDNVNPKDARDLLLQFHRVAQDMMHALGFPNNMISFMGHGSLGLHRLTKRSRALGSYVPATRQVNLWGRANSFGHEWTHALDHDIALTMNLAVNKQFLASQLGRANILDPNDPLAARMGHLLNTLFYDQADQVAQKLLLQVQANERDALGNPTVAADRAQKILDGMKVGAAVKGIQGTKYEAMAAQFGDPDYWANEAELLARAGEAYLARTMEAMGLDPRGALMPDEAYLADTDRRLRETFPKLDERRAIFDAFDHLMDGYRKTALHGTIPASKASQLGISDPKVWGKLNPKAKLGPLKLLMSRLRNSSATLARSSLFDPTRPDPQGRNLAKRMVWLGTQLTHSKMGVLESLHHFVPDEAKAPLQDIMDRIGYTAGSGRYTSWVPFEERMHTIVRQAVNRYANILENHDLDHDKLTPELKEQIRYVMTTGDDKLGYPVDPLDPNSKRLPIDPRVKAAAGPLRDNSDIMHQLLRDANIPVGYSLNGHYPRIYDPGKVQADPKGFINGATKVYRLMFDRDVGQPGDNPSRLLEQWVHGTKGKDGLPVKEQDGMRELSRALRKQRKAMDDITNNGLTPARQAKFDAAKAEAQRLAQQHHDGVGDYLSKASAEDFHYGITTYEPDDFTNMAPGGGFLKGRTLPPETDTILRDWMLTDPSVVLPHYYESVARKVAYAERFGHKGEQLKELLKQAQRGGMTQEDARIVDNIVKSITGQTQHRYDPWAVAANGAHALGTIYMLGRTAFSMMVEPMNIALATDDVRAGFTAFAGHLHQMVRSSTAEELSELCDMLGITTSAEHDNVMLNRSSMNDFSDTPRIGKFLTQYYRVTGATWLTNFNRKGVAYGAHYQMRRWAMDRLNTGGKAGDSFKRDKARRWFNELGIGSDNPRESDRIQKAFAEWLLELDGLPSRDEVQTGPHGENYAKALRRLTRRGVIDPTKAEQPIDSPQAKMLYQFNNFSYGYQRNILDAMVRRWGHAYEYNYDWGKAKGEPEWKARMRGSFSFAKAFGNSAGIIASVIVGNLVQSTLRQLLFNYESFKKHEEEGTLWPWLFELSMSTSGLGGTIDLPAQAITNLRYASDFSGLLQGPSMKYISKNAYDVAVGLETYGDVLTGGEAPTTNTRYHDAVRGAYNLIASPMASFMATKIGQFGPLAFLASTPLVQYGSSQRAAEEFATLLTGPKGAEAEGEGGGGEGGGDESTAPDEAAPQPDTGADAEPEPAGDTGGGGTKAAEQTPATGISGLPLGLLDDFVVPTAKAASPVINALPPGIKGTAMVALAAWSAYEFYAQTEPYRNAPAPQETTQP